MNILSGEPQALRSREPVFCAKRGVNTFRNRPKGDTGIQGGLDPLRPYHIMSNNDIIKIFNLTG